MANLFDLESLKIFCDLVELQSFTRAADHHFISQSAVSQRLRALEREYGQSLLDRGQGRGQVVPTDAGRRLYNGAKRLLLDAAALDEELRSLSDEVAGTVRVATVYSIGLHALPPRLKPFLAAYPGVNVHLEYKQTGSVYQEVLSGLVDVGIVAVPLPRRGLKTIPFGEDQMVLICAPEHPLALEKSVRFRQLEAATFVGFADDIPTRKLIDDHLRRAGVRVRMAMAFDNIETIKNLVEIGSGVSIVPVETVRPEVREGRLAAIPFDAPDRFLRPTGLLIKSRSPQRAAVKAFIEAMRQGAAPEAGFSQDKVQ